MLLEAASTIGALPVVLRFRGLRALHSRLSRSTSARVGGAVVGVVPPRVLEVARVVAIAARYSPRDRTCLHRSLTLWWMLRRRGFDARLHMGVRKGEVTFEAHAWVEYADVVLNDAPDVSQLYEPWASQLAESDR
jgi:hypothetical protein